MRAAEQTRSLCSCAGCVGFVIALSGSEFGYIDRFGVVLCFGVVGLMALRSLALVGVRGTSAVLLVYFARISLAHRVGVCACVIYVYA